MTPWTDERAERVKALWQAGRSAAEIATAVGDCTRNSVIGLVHRRKWDGGSVPMPRGAARRDEPRRPRSRDGGIGIKIATGTFGKKTRAAPRPVRVAPREDIPHPVSRAVSLVDLNSFTCRWPDGERDDVATSYCGQMPFGNAVYCEFHCGLAYVAPAKRNIEGLAGLV